MDEALAAPAEPGKDPVQQQPGMQTPMDGQMHGQMPPMQGQQAMMPQQQGMMAGSPMQGQQAMMPQQQGMMAGSIQQPGAQMVVQQTVVTQETTLTAPTTKPGKKPGQHADLCCLQLILCQTAQGCGIYSSYLKGAQSCTFIDCENGNRDLCRFSDESIFCFCCMDNSTHACGLNVKFQDQSKTTNINIPMPKR
eukprot:SAG22_NODE_5249_length_1053_cov_0.840671_1_plen_193_part_01